jgi:ribonuclease III
MENFMEPCTMDENRLAVLHGLEKRLGYRFRNIHLLSTALTHRSYANEYPQLALADNERLEFLGDAVLGLGVSDMLIKKYEDIDEGDLSKIRAALVNEKPLALLAATLQIGAGLLLGRGEENSGGRAKESLLANAFEAVIAAVYLDSSFIRTKNLIIKLMEPFLQEDNIQFQCFDYKTALQEYCQKKYKTAPLYITTDTSGPDHARIFEVTVKIADEIVETGSGKSKKEAEKHAAQKAWKALHCENQ